MPEALGEQAVTQKQRQTWITCLETLGEYVATFQEDKSQGTFLKERTV